MMISNTEKKAGSDELPVAAPRKGLLQGGFDLHQAAAEAMWSQKPGVADVEQEYTEYECQVLEGEVPDWMQGSLFRQGGGAFPADDAAAFLDGLAHLSAFHIKNGKVAFSNKYLRTQQFRKFISSGERDWAGTAKAATKDDSLVTRLTNWLVSLCPWANKDLLPPAVFNDKFNPNVTVWALSKPSDDTDEKTQRFAAMTEVNNVCEFDPISLDTLGAVQPLVPSPKKSVITTSAHWFFDMDTMEGGFHVGLELGYKLTLKGPVFDLNYAIWFGDEPPKKLVASHPLANFAWGERASQPLEKRAAYMHAVAQSKNYFVLIETSWRIRYESLLDNDLSNGFFGMFDKADIPVNFIVYRINHKSKEDGATPGVELVGSFPCAPETKGMLWHVGNSFEDEENNLVIDATFGSLDEEFGAATTSKHHNLCRFTINVSDVGSQAECQQLTNLGTDSNMAGNLKVYEFPNVNPLFHFRPTRFVYCIQEPNMGVNSTVVRVDTTKVGEKGSLLGFQDFEGKQAPTEPVFVPRPGGSDSELDGLLVFEMINLEKRGSILHFVCPQTMKTVAKIQTPAAANFGLHSIWQDGSNTKTITKY